MPITAVTYQNGVDSINAAYRPIVFRCKAHNPNPTPENYKPELVFCDIYVEEVYYKSLWKSAPINDDGIAPEYEFDIQDSIQELLSYNLPNLYNRNILGFDKTIKHVFVRFRNCFIQNGFVESEQVAPVQGTSSTTPISGGGTQSNAIYVLNSNIQHEESQSLTGLLAQYRYGQFATGILPLTKRPKRFKLCKDDSSYFPIVSSQRPTKVCIRIHDNFGDYEEHCSDFLVDCPTIENLTYSNIKNSNNQTFIFNWTLPENWEITSGLKIYYRENGETEWLNIEVGINPTASITLPFGKYDFRFELFGSCNNNISVGSLPGFTNIGHDESENQPPVVSIYWNDTHTTEPRSCDMTTTCVQLMSVNTISDPDNNLDYFVWQRSPNGGTSWSNISSPNQNTISFQTVAEGEYIFRVKAVDILGTEGLSNHLLYNVSKEESESANITFIQGLPNTCPDAGEILNFTIEGSINQTVNFQVKVINGHGHGASLRIYEDTTDLFSASLHPVVGQTFEGSINLGGTGVKTFRGEMCLRPCLNTEYSSMAITLTLYNNDGVTLSDQYVLFQASMSCE